MRGNDRSGENAAVQVETRVSSPPTSSRFVRVSRGLNPSIKTLRARPASTACAADASIVLTRANWPLPLRFATVLTRARHDAVVTRTCVPTTRACSACGQRRWIMADCLALLAVVVEPHVPQPPLAVVLRVHRRRLARSMSAKKPTHAKPTGSPQRPILVGKSSHIYVVKVDGAGNCTKANVRKLLASSHRRDGGRFPKSVSKRSGSTWPGATRTPSASTAWRKCLKMGRTLRRWWTTEVATWKILLMATLASCVLEHRLS